LWFPQRKYFRHDIHKNINLQNLIIDEDKIRGSQVPHTKDRISSFLELKVRKKGFFEAFEDFLQPIHLR
jgi:hypothetical protein